jgi:uncharacterized protein (TIGR03437 family)
MKWRSALQRGKDQAGRQGLWLSRRESLRWLGAAGTGAIVGGLDGHPLQRLLRGSLATAVEAAGPLPSVLQTALFTPKPVAALELSQLSCVARPALTEGPFFVDELLNRSDIRPDPANNTVRAGTPLKIKFTVGKVSGSACTPLAGAYFDLWHCDALGAYSDVNGQGNPNNLGQKFLRGYQITDSNGAVEFQTIYPGWYTGRTTHIHYKVRLFAGASKTYEFTSQTCFDDTFTDQVYAAAPYNTKGARGTRNSNDMIYQQGGATLLMNVTADGAGGLRTEYVVGVSNVPNGVAGISTVSAASFTGALTPDSIAALFGTGLAASAVVATTATLPTELGGVQVLVRDANGTSRNAPLFFVSPTQINFQLPAGTAAGSAVIFVRQGTTVVGQGTATIATVAPSLFSANATGQGVPAAVALRVKADNTQSFETVAQFNQTTNRFEAVPLDLGAATDQLFLIIFGTGFRYRSSLAAVTATLGGAAAELSFAGAQGSLTGLDQANLRIPRNLAGRGNVDLNFTVDGQTANTVTLNIK